MTLVVGASGVVMRDGKILLVRRGHDPYEGRWSLPGGKVEADEPIRETVRREVREETGLDVDVGRVAGLHDETDAGRFLIIAFHVTVTGGELCAGDDAAACEWVDLTELTERETTPGLIAVLRDAGLLD